MAELGTMARALVNAGLVEEPKKSRKRNNGRKFTCKKCGQEMVKNENTNTMSCTNCSNYYIFKQ